jgi:hypothetical protein
MFIVSIIITKDFSTFNIPEVVNSNRKYVLWSLSIKKDAVKFEVIMAVDMMPSSLVKKHVFTSQKNLIFNL